MIIHSIISMDDIFNRPEYMTEAGIGIEASRKKTNGGFIETSAVNGKLKTEDFFSTDPSAYLKYIL